MAPRAQVATKSQKDIKTRVNCSCANHWKADIQADPLQPDERSTGPCIMIILDNVITDRGSKYAVSGGPCHSADEARRFIAELKSNKKFAKATHSSWGLICGDQMIKNDDGEAGAGMVILRMLEREGLRDHIVVVTRWFGGKQLGGDRFRHVQEAVRTYIKAL